VHFNVDIQLERRYPRRAEFQRNSGAGWCKPIGCGRRDDRGK
jgi:hypothetical protein